MIINAFFFVGMTGFEPATTRPPDAYSTGLSYIPLYCDAKVMLLFEIYKNELPITHLLEIAIFASGCNFGLLKRKF